MASTEIATTNSRQTLSSEPPLTEKLRDLVAGNESPVIGPNSAAALQAWLDGPWPELPLPTKAQIDSFVSRISLATKERPSSKAEAAERLEVYWRALRDLPVADLARGFDDLIRSMRFMPTPAEIRAACGKHLALREYRKSRARHLIALHEREWQPPIADPVEPHLIEQLKRDAAHVLSVDDQRRDAASALSADE